MHRKRKLQLYRLWRKDVLTIDMRKRKKTKANASHVKNYTDKGTRRALRRLEQKEAREERRAMLALRRASEALSKAAAERGEA